MLISFYLIIKFSLFCSFMDQNIPFDFFNITLSVTEAKISLLLFKFIDSKFCL